MNTVHTVANLGEFRALVEEASERSGVEVLFFELNESQELSICEDDGNLHVSRFGLRACYDIGQELPMREYIRLRERILRYLGQALD